MNRLHLYMYVCEYVQVFKPYSNKLGHLYLAEAWR